MGDITVKIELRPCLAKGEKALFHRWITEEQIASGDLIKVKPKALVEYEDGTLDLVSYKNIKFIDKKHQQYCWDNNREGVKHG